MAGSNSLGQLTVSLAVDAADFTQGMTKAEYQAAQSARRIKDTFIGTFAGGFAKDITKSFTDAFAQIPGQLVGIVKEAIDAADHLNDLSKKTGIAVSTLGGLGFAAKQSGSDLESVSDGAGKLNRSLAEAAAGGKAQGAAFAALGISVRDAAGNVKSADQAFKEIADKFAGYEDGANKTALAVALFGKAGANLIPLLDEGGASIQRNIAYYEKYAGITAKTAAEADAFNDTLAKINLLSGSFSRTLASELLPSLQGVADKFLQAKESGNQFKDLASDLTEILKGVATAATYAAEYIDNVRLRIAKVAATASVAADLFKQGATSNPDSYSGPTDADLNETQRKVGALRAIQEGYNEDVDKSAKRWGGLRDAINNTTAAAQRGSKFQDDYYNKTTKKQAPGIAQTAGGSGGDKKDPFDSYVSGLGSENAKLQFDIANFDRFKGATESSKRAVVEFELEYGKFSDAVRQKSGFPALTQAQKDNALSLADTISKQAEYVKQLKALSAFDDQIARIKLDTSLIGQDNSVREEAIRLFELEKQGILKGTAAYEQRAATLHDVLEKERAANEALSVRAFQYQGQQSANDSRFEIEQIGKNKAAIEDLTATRRIDQEVAQRTKNAQGDPNVLPETLAAITAEGEAQKRQLLADNATRRSLQNSALTGAKDFFNQYQDAANDSATAVKNVLTDAFQGAEDAFVKFVQTGKLSFSDLAASVEADVLRFGFKQIANYGLKQLEGAFPALAGITGTKDAASGLSGAANSAAITSFTGALTTSTPALVSLSTAATAAATALATVATSSAASGGANIFGLLGNIKGTNIGTGVQPYSVYNDPAFVNSAKGNAFGGGNVIPFARGGIVSSPHSFPLNNGKRGIMGEAGAEAVVPLTRTANGDLGIQMTGGGDTYVTNNNINVPSDTTRDLRTGSQFGRAVQRGLGG